MVTLIKQRLLDLASDIATSPPEDLAFTHSVLAQTSLPTAKPPDGMLRWERRQGRATLLVVAGEALDPKTQKFTQLPLPYGPKARLLLMHLNSEAVRRQSPVIPVEDSMTAFFRRVMGKTQDGRHISRLKAQLASLAAATFRLGIMQGDDRALQVDTKVVSAFDLWFPKNETQRVLWPSTLRLSLIIMRALPGSLFPWMNGRSLPLRTQPLPWMPIAGWHNGFIGFQLDNRNSSLG